MKKLLFLLFISLLFSCDNKQNTLKEWKLNGKVKSLTVTKYSAVEKFREPERDEFLFETEYVFDKDGFYKKLESFSADGELLSKAKPKYGDDGNIKEFKSYDGDGKFLGKGKYKYDNDGNIKEYRYYNSENELLDKQYFKYDSDGNVIEYKYYSDGKLNHKVNYKWDDDGLFITQFKEYDMDGKFKRKLKYKYNDFDNKKNWQESIGYERGKAVEITERDIEYYD
tara:strand:+ start:708 stop:1382 length:675 start_codon:yes stop_codon:yes gene_type:complete